MKFGVHQLCLFSYVLYFLNVEQREMIRVPEKFPVFPFPRTDFPPTSFPRHQSWMLSKHARLSKSHHRNKRSFVSRIEFDTRNSASSQRLVQYAVRSVADSKTRYLHFPQLSLNSQQILVEALRNLAVELIFYSSATK